MSIENNTRITSKDLLAGFLDLRGLTSEFDNWTDELLSGNPPRLIRLRQLVALFQAFGIPWGPQSFAEGKFIQPEHPRYDLLLSKLSTELLGETTRSVLADRNRLPKFFATLFDYRMRVDGILLFNSGVLSASGLFHLSYCKIGDLNRIIQENIVNIDDTLAMLISPEVAAFSVEQLVQDYGYPDVNLFEIDVDWL